MTARWEVGSLYHKSFPSVWRDDKSMWGFQVKVLLKLENRVTKASFAKLSSFKPSYWSSQSAQHLHIQEASE